MFERRKKQFILHSVNLFCDEQWTLLGNQILHRRSGIISIHVTHLRLYKCLQVHVIANARLVRFVLVRLSFSHLFIYFSLQNFHRKMSNKISLLTRRIKYLIFLFLYNLLFFSLSNLIIQSGQRVNKQ